MNELVFKGTNNQVLTNSLLVAEKFGKEHRRVMQDIRELGCSQSFREHNFVLSSYNSLQNKELPMYAMTKDGFTLLAMGYTGELAMKFKEEYISAFNKMEQIIKSGGYQIPSSFKEALLLAAHQQEQIDEQQKQISVCNEYRNRGDEEKDRLSRNHTLQQRHSSHHADSTRLRNECKGI